MEKSSFFNGVNVDGSNTYDREYFAEDFADYFKSFIGNGVFLQDDINDLRVCARSDGYKIYINKGKAWINGYFYHNTDELNFDIEEPDGALNRIDRVVLRLDFFNREIKIYIKTGEFSLSPEPVDLERDEDIYELNLAFIHIKKGLVNITDADIEDTRLSKEICGIVHGIVEQIDATTLYNQVQSDLSLFKTREQLKFREFAENEQDKFRKFRAKYELEFIKYMEEQQEGFNTWFDKIKNTLSDNPIGNLFTILDDHINTRINNELGVHGLRYHDNILAYLDEDYWDEITTSGSGQEQDKNTYIYKIRPSLNLIFEDGLYVWDINDIEETEEHFILNL